MKKIIPDTARSWIVHTMEEALAVAAEVGFRASSVPSFTMAAPAAVSPGNREEFEEICERGLTFAGRMSC